jgi:hypothetical protein
MLFPPFISLYVPSPLFKNTTQLKRYCMQSSGKVEHAAGMMSRIGNRLFEESKAVFADDSQASSSVSWTGRDLLSMLVRANVSKDLPASQRMLDEDVIARMYLFNGIIEVSR